MELFFLAILVLIMIAALASGYPVAFALPGLAILSYIVRHRSFKIGWRLQPWWGLPLSCCVIAPWLIPVAQKHSHFL